VLLILRLGKKELAVEIEEGAIIGLTGNLNGKLVLKGLEATFQWISELLYGMKPEGARIFHRGTWKHDRREFFYWIIANEHSSRYYGSSHTTRKFQDIRVQFGWRDKNFSAE